MKLPEDYQDDPAYNPLQPAYNPSTTYSTTPIITNSNNNTTTLQHEKSTQPEENIVKEEDFVEAEKNFSAQADWKGGCKAVKLPPAIEYDTCKDHAQPTKNTQCLTCKRSIGSGHGSYYNGNFCSTCGPKLTMVKAAWKVHPEYSLSELWEDLAARGRPPKKEHLPFMIEYLKAEAA